MSLISKKDKTIKIRTCRICLDANRVDMVSIEEQNGWLKLFEFCFGFTLTTHDEPRLLCKICAEKVQSYVKFKEKCHKSHSLWKSVISDVKCCIVQHQNVENANENANDPITSTTEIKDEPFDTFFDSDIDYPNDDDSAMIDLSPVKIVKIKTETRDECDAKTSDDESKNKKKKDSLTKKVNSAQINCENSNIKGSVKSKEKKTYTCAKCTIVYEMKKCYMKHIRVCQGKKSRRFFNQDYAYDLGRQYNGQNIDKVKQESQIEIIENQNQHDSSYSCGLCKLSFATTKDVCIHLNDHWSNNDLACKLCDFVGVDLAAIAAHRYSHFPRNDTVRFFCHICEKKQHSLLALHFHYRRVHLKKCGGYCSRCNKEFRMSRHWKKHELRHSAPKYICDICGKKYYFRHVIREHMINHMKLNRCICDICGKSFNRQRYMKLHKETVHTESGPLECTHCNRKFKSEFSLNKHLHNQVFREKTLKCEVCGKAFITPNTLKLHMAMHSKERPYSCNVCGCSYKYKSNLTNHQQKHYGLMPQCSICKKSFASMTSLQRHSSVHTGVRQHCCIVTSCVRSFYSKKLMLAHVEKRHKNEKGGDLSERK